MHVKIHEQSGKKVLAACDSSLLGKEFEEGQRHFKAYESFYAGEQIEKEKFLGLLEEHDSINLFGEECVNAAIEKGLITEDAVIRIQGIPHAQIFKFGQ